MPRWRTSGARLRRWRMRGLRMLTLENARLRVTLAVGKGGEVVEFVDKPRDIDYCSYDESGPIPVPRGGGFIDAYRGGWQEIFPSGGAPTVYRDAALDQHAEVATLPWRARIVRDDPREVEVELSVRTTRLPFELRRRVRLADDATRLHIAGRASNLSPVHLDAMWGQHLAFGAPFLRAGCRIRVPDGVHMVAEAGDPVPWPAEHRVPGAGASSEMHYLTGFDDGWYELTDPDGREGLRVEWDTRLMPYLWYWQEFGAGIDHPFWGRRYALGLEPFSSLPTAGLAEAARNGSALRFDPYETKEFTWSAGPITQTGTSRDG